MDYPKLWFLNIDVESHIMPHLFITITYVIVNTFA